MIQREAMESLVIIEEYFRLSLIEAETEKKYS